MKTNEMHHTHEHGNHEEHCKHKHENGVCKHEDGYEHPVHEHNNQNTSDHKCHCGCSSCNCDGMPKGHCCD